MGWWVDGELECELAGIEHPHSAQAHHTDFEKIDHHVRQEWSNKYGLKFASTPEFQDCMDRFPLLHPFQNAV